MTTKGGNLELYTVFDLILKNGETAAKNAKSADGIASLLGGCKVLAGLGAIWIEAGGSKFSSPEHYCEHLSHKDGAAARAALLALNKENAQFFLGRARRLGRHGIFRTVFPFISSAIQTFIRYEYKNTSQMSKRS